MLWRSPREGSSALKAAPTVSRSRASAQEQIALVSQAVQAIGFAINREAALETACSALIELMDAQVAAAYIVERGGQRGHLLLVEGEGATGLPEWMTIPSRWQSEITYGPITSLMLEGVPVLRGQGIQSFVAAPLHHGAIFRGVVLAFLPDEVSPPDMTLDLLRMLMTQLAGFLDSREMFSVLEDYAMDMAQLAHLMRISTSSMNVEQLSTNVSSLLGEMMMADVTVALREGGRLRLYDANGTGMPSLELSTVPELQRLIDQPQDSLAIFTRETPNLSRPLVIWLEGHRGDSLTILPLIANHALEGFLLLSAPIANLEQRAPILEMAANQIALQLFNAHGHQRVQEALRQRLDELALIEDFARRITTVLNVDEIAAQVLRAALTATHADVATLTLANDDEKFTTMRLERDGSGVAFRHLPGEQVRDELPPWLRQALDERTPRLIHDARKTFAATSGPRSYAAVPLQRDNETLGVLSVESKAARRFTSEQLTFLGSLAGHTGISLENARLLEEHQYQIVALRNLQALAIELTGVETTRDAAQAAIDAATEMLGADEGAMYSYDPAGGNVTLVVARSGEGPVRHRAAMSREALAAITNGEIRTRTYANGQRTVVALPINRALTAGRYALSLFFGRNRPLRQRDVHNLLILSSYVASQLDNTALNEQVRASSSRMRAILDTTDSAILMLDRSGIVLDINRSAERLLHVDAAGVLGKHVSAVFMSLQSSGGVGLSQTAITEFVHRLSDAPDQPRQRQFERSMDGISQHLVETVSPVHNETNHVVGHLLVYRDVTDQVRNAQYRDQVTHMVIHDLRGPLWSIISGIDLAQDDLRSIPEAEPTLKLLEISATSAQNLMRLVESLLDISRLEQGQFPLNRTPTSPLDLVEAAREALDSAVKAAPISLRVDCDPVLPLIDVDLDMMRRVLINLIDNAVRHTPMQGEILVRAYANRQDIVFLVADSGPGIPADMREAVFERYRQLPQNRPQRGSKGLGLGLAFCKLAVEAHGGHIAVEPSGPLSGATFSVSIPIWRGE
ncbi:MAG: GAF domain-containing protein [Anaerolineae bacterium]